MTSEDWEIPPHLQPDPSALSFELDTALRSVLRLRALVPEDAFTANVLGTEREGSGVLIGENGLVLTIGYLVTEAEVVWLTTAEGRAVPAHPLAVDQETGFGLVQALGPLDMPVINLGDSEKARLGAPTILASAGGRKHAVATRLVARQAFAGYWEYLLEDALFTAPAHPSWGGAALIGRDGRLLGIGSLVLQQGDGEGEQRSDLNMVVPIHRLKPILDDLLTRGRVNRPARPWLGLYATEDDEGLTVASLAPGGPAERAGVRPGDRILAVGGKEVSELLELWPAIWACGPAGATVPLRLARKAVTRDVEVVSADRSSFLKGPRLH